MCTDFAPRGQLMRLRSRAHLQAFVVMVMVMVFMSPATARLQAIAPCVRQLARAGPLGKRLTLDRAGRVAMDTGVLSRRVDKFKKQAFQMKENRGYFWPRAIFEAYHDQKLHPSEVFG